MNGKSKYWFLAVVLLAAVLRLHHVRQPFVDCISWRQASTATIAQNFYKGNWNIFMPEVTWTGPGPSYQGREFQTVTYMAALLYVFFGQHDYIGRAISISFGLLGIIALYMLVKRLRGEKHALASAAMLALIPGSIFVDRSFLPDPAMVALMVTSCWMLVAYLQTDFRRYLALACVTCTLGLLTKITGLIIGLPMLYAAISILKRRNRLTKQRIAILCAAAFMSLLPVVAYYLWARHLSVSYPPYHFAGGGNWVWNDGPAAWLEKIYFFPKLQWIMKIWLWGKPVIFLLLAGLLLKPALSRNSIHHRGKYDAPFFFHFWLIAGLVFYAIGAKELVSNWWNLHILNPAAAVFAGAAVIFFVSAIGSVTHSKSLRVLAAASIIFFLFLSGRQRLQQMYAPGGSWDAAQSRKMGLMLRDVSKPDDLVVTLANTIGDPVAIYYSGRRGWVFPPAADNFDWGKLPDNQETAVRMFDDLRSQGAAWFGMVNVHIETLRARYPLFLSHIRNTCILEVANGEWMIFRVMPPGSGNVGITSGDVKERT